MGRGNGQHCEDRPGGAPPARPGRLWLYLPAIKSVKRPATKPWQPGHPICGFLASSLYAQGLPVHQLPIFSRWLDEELDSEPDLAAMITNQQQGERP